MWIKLEHGAGADVCISAEWCLSLNQKLVIVSSWEQIENCQPEEKKSHFFVEWMNETKDMKATLTVI